MLFYLAGLITGCSYDAAKKWRQKVSVALYPTHGVLDPLRFNHPNMGHKTAGFGTPVRRNCHDLDRCDGMIMNLDYATRISFGSIAEAAWCYQLRKPSIAIVGEAHDHQYLKERFTYIVNDLDEAIEAARVIGEEA